MDAIDDLHAQIDDIQTLGVEGPDADVAAARLEALVQEVESLLERDPEGSHTQGRPLTLEPRQLDLSRELRA